MKFAHMIVLKWFGSVLHFLHPSHTLFLKIWSCSCSPIITKSKNRPHRGTTFARVSRCKKPRVFRLFRSKVRFFTYKFSKNVVSCIVSSGTVVNDTKPILSWSSGYQLSNQLHNIEICQEMTIIQPVEIIWMLAFNGLHTRIQLRW